MSVKCPICPVLSALGEFSRSGGCLTGHFTLGDIQKSGRFRRKCPPSQPPPYKGWRSELRREGTKSDICLRRMGRMPELLSGFHCRFCWRTSPPAPPLQGRGEYLMSVNVGKCWPWEKKRVQIGGWANISRLAIFEKAGENGHLLSGFSHQVSACGRSPPES